MKRSALVPLFALALMLSPLQAATPAGHYLAAGAIDLTTALPPPPAPGSLAAQADFETVLQVQAMRTPADVAWAKFIETDEVFNNAKVLGDWFTKENLPVTAEFLKQVTADMTAVKNYSKETYPRRRPPFSGPGLQPCVSIPPSNSYPSGHSTTAYFWAAVLSDIFPEQQAGLVDRAHRAAWGRVIGGVHFPSDTIGGRLLAEAIIEAIRKNPEYRAGVEKCRAEAAPFLLKKAA